MVVQRTPPQVRRSPRKGSSQPPEAPFSSQSSQKIGKIVSSTPSTASRAVPSTPVPHNGASDFPSLDQMAAVSKEQRSVTRPTTNRAAFAASFPATSSNHVPSSLPRPTAQARSIQTEQISDDIQRTRAARSSLTNGAIQRVRQLAGDETPLGVSQARAARQANTANSSKADASLVADDSGDSTAQLVPGRRDAALNPLLASIDVENPQMPSLAPPAASIAASDAAPQAADDAAAADSSTASQASIFGTANRRNGRDQPIGSGTAAAGVAYDFSKYLDGELDPFNRASRANPRRDSRPLSAQPPGDGDEDAGGADTSGDTTARGGLAVPSATVSATAPIESTPLFSRVKAAAAAATPRMSPHASPSVSSRKLAHLSSLANGHSTPTAAAAASSATAADASSNAHSRFDPSARTDRIQTMELGELRKKATALSRDLAAAQDSLSAAKEESEGWASECTGLQEQIATLKAASQRESRARTELSVRLSQYKIEADDRAWKLLSQRRQACLIDVALQHAKNEATYHEGRYHATESELEGEKDELRIRLMLEKKRADLLAMHVKVALRDGARLKKRLSAKSAAVLELQAENQSLAEQLEDAQHSQGSTKHARDHGEAAALKQQLEEAQAEIETLNERDAMMAETRKTWKAERKELLAQVEQLSSSASASAPVAKTTVEAVRPLKTIKSVVSASQMLPPSSPVYAKKKRPMQGASELEPPSEDEEADRRAVMAATAVARKPAVSKTNAPLVPFAQLSTKVAASTKKTVKPAPKPAVAAPAPAKKSSKNWRDEIAITDSDESDSDSDSASKRPSKSTKSKSTATKKSTTKSTVTSSTAGRKTKPSMPIEYDDQTADPSATPIIRSNKRIAQQDSDDDDDAGPLDSSVLAKFGRDRTNLATSSLATKKLTGLKTSAVAAGKTTDAGAGKKKKRKLLGGGNAAMQWSDAGGLAPNFDIPLELSPIKGGAKAVGGGAAAFMAGFGMPARNPFA